MACGLLEQARSTVVLKENPIMPENPSVTMNQVLEVLKEALQDVQHVLHYFTLNSVDLEVKLASVSTISAGVSFEPVKLGVSYASSQITIIKMKLEPPGRRLDALEVSEAFSRGLIAVLTASKDALSGDIPLRCSNASVAVSFVITEKGSLEVVNLKGKDWWASIGAKLEESRERTHSFTLNVTPN
jgi:hypothetical protein